MCKLINVIEEPFYVYVDKCYRWNLFMCTLINVIGESFYVYAD